MVYEEAKRLHLVTKTVLGLESKQNLHVWKLIFWYEHDLQTCRLICSEVRFALAGMQLYYSFALTWTRPRVTLLTFHKEQ